MSRSTIESLQQLEALSQTFLWEHPLPTWIIASRDLKIHFANRAACKAYGYSNEEFMALSFLDIFPEESRLGFFRAVNAPGQKFSYHSRQLKKDGEAIFVEIYAAPILISEILHFQVSAVDITDRVEARQSIEEERQRYKTFIEQSTEGIYCQEWKQPLPIDLPFEELIAMSKTNSSLTYCNDSLARMYGYHTAAELEGMVSDQLLDLDEPANIIYFRNFVDNGFKVVNAESLEKDRHGQPRYFLNNAIGIIENGKLVRVWGTQRDITNEKRIESELRLLANLVKQTSDVLTAADKDFKPISWNRAAEEVYGLKAEEVLGRNLSELITIHYRKATRDEVRKTIREKGEWRGEAWFIRPTDHKKITLIISFKLLRDQDHQFLGYLISATDITERKETEWRLKESEKRFREMADSSPAMIWMTDENKQTTYVNKEWFDFTGKDMGSEKGEWTELLHKDDVERAKLDFDKAVEVRKPVTLIYRLRHRDGSYHWVHDVSVPRFINEKEFIGYIGSVVDIQDQKQKQEQLLYQATVLENVSDIVVTTDLNYVIKTWNKVAAAYYGFSEEEALGKNIGTLVKFNFLETTAADALEELKEKGIWKGEVSLSSNGNTTYFLHTVKYVYDDNNKRIGFLATGKDITDRKIAEERLVKSEQFYRALIADSLDGMILVDKEGTVSFSSPSVKNVLGYEAEEVEGRTVFEFVHPEDIKLATEGLEREILEKPELKYIVVRLLKKSGEWLWCMVRGHNMLRNPYINGIVIYFHDETFRKQATEALKESERRFRHLISDLQVGVMLLDKEGRVLLSNEAAAEILSANKEHMLGHDISDIALDPIHEDGRKFEENERPAQKVLHTLERAKDVVMGIYRERVKERGWVLINASPVFDEKGEIRHIISSLKDITELKKMEEDQRSKQLTHQRQLTQATIDGQEKERKEIGKELHDNIGQQLTTIKLFLDLAKTTADENTNEMVSLALKGISDVINDIRAMSRSLVPSTLKDLGLVESIDELVDSIALTQLLRIDFDCDHFEEGLLPENQKLTLFRIVQEQMNNIVKHSNAEEVWIELTTSVSAVVLKIRDDGQGFDPQQVRMGHGLTNIKNRAELFNGKTEIISSPGNGCLVRVCMPLAQEPLLPA